MAVDEDDKRFTTSAIMPSKFLFAFSKTREGGGIAVG